MAELPLEIQLIQGQPDVALRLQGDLERLGVLAEFAKVELARCATVVSSLQSELSDLERQQLGVDVILSNMALLGQCENVQYVLDLGASVAFCVKGKTALHYAAWKGHC